MLALVLWAVGYLIAFALAVLALETIASVRQRRRQASAQDRW
jgi:hypothetical protein